MLAEGLIRPDEAAAFDRTAHSPELVPAPRSDSTVRPAVLRLLCAASHVSVVSAAPEEHVQRCLQALNVSDLLGGAVIGSTALKHRPKSQRGSWAVAAAMALGRQLTGEDRVVVLDDHTDNLKAAQLDGFETIMVGGDTSLAMAAEIVENKSREARDCVLPAKL